MPQAAPLIDATGLCRNYGPLHAVDRVDLRLERGEILGLLGQNGAGKTTTMELLCGVLAPTAGRIAIDGVDLLESPRAAKRGLGYLPERPPLHDEMPVRAFLIFAATLRRVVRSQRHSAVDRALALCGLAEVAHRPIGNLSKGYRQRVGIAQAIVHDPPAIVLDEPTVGLDPVQIQEIRTLIGDLGREHGVILSTHILPEVQALCSRVAVLHRGRIVHSGPMTAFTTEGPVERLIVGLQRMPATDALRALPGVTAVEVLDHQHARLALDPAAGNAAAIAERAVAADWGLTELTPERTSLEQLFVDLTSADAVEPATAA